MVDTSINLDSTMGRGGRNSKDDVVEITSDPPEDIKVIGATAPTKPALGMSGFMNAVSNTSSSQKAPTSLMA